MQITGITTALPELKEQADLVVQCAEETRELIHRLESMKGVQPHLDAIDRLESEGDAVHRRILARLFGGEFGTLEVLRWKDVIESMEAALNTLEDISDIVESIVLKRLTAPPPLDGRPRRCPRHRRRARLRLRQRLP